MIAAIIEKQAGNDWLVGNPHKQPSYRKDSVYLKHGFALLQE